MKKIRGFSFIELLITLSILGILSVIALPIYSSHRIKAYRLEAAVTLSQLAVAIEEYFTIHNTYAGINLKELGFQDRIAENHYKLNIASGTMDQFTIEAIPLIDQADKDTLCGKLSLDSFNQKHISGKGTIHECW